MRWAPPVFFGKKVGNSASYGVYWAVARYFYMPQKQEKFSIKEEKSTTIPNTPVRFIWYVTMEYKWIALPAILVVSIAVGLGLFASYFFKLIIDASETGDMRQVLHLVLLFPVVVLIEELFYRSSGFLGSIWTNGIKKYANDILVRYLFNHSHRYFSDRFSGSLLSKVSNVLGALESFVPDLLWTHLPSFLYFTAIAVFIWRADTFSGLCFVLLVVVLVVTNHIFAKRKKELSYKTSELNTTLRGIIVDVFSNISAVRHYVRTDQEVQRVYEASEAWTKAGRANWQYTEIMLTLNSFILFGFSLGIFYFLAHQWSSGGMSTGEFVFIMALYSQLIGRLLFIGRAFNNTARSFGEIEEGLAEILQPIEIVDRDDAKRLSVEGGKIEWNNVTFKYEENIVFNDFNLAIKPGERIGLVGSSGAGKTTFVSLLLRQHELSGGQILIDGQDIAEVTQDSLREHIAVVPQEPMLFHRTIRENIVYGKPDATDEEVIAVAKKAQAHDFISSLPLGYDTLVGERGVKLSGGQKQRVAIARAMLKNAPILVLDEATSALDSESEVAIQKALHELMEGKTVIAIAHRLSTLREMDRIIVLEQGKIIEDGTHDTLTKNGGLYARLWEHQAGGFLQD